MAHRFPPLAPQPPEKPAARPLTPARFPWPELSLFALLGLLLLG